MKKKNNGKKNRSIEESESLSPPKSRVLGNSPKRSKMESLGRDSAEGMVHEGTIPPNIVDMDNVVNQVTIEPESHSNPSASGMNNRSDLHKFSKI